MSINSEVKSCSFVFSSNDSDDENDARDVDGGRKKAMFAALPEAMEPDRSSSGAAADDDDACGKAPASSSSPLLPGAPAPCSPTSPMASDAPPPPPPYPSSSSSSSTADASSAPGNGEHPLSPNSRAAAQQQFPAGSSKRTSSPQQRPRSVSRSVFFDPLSASGRKKLGFAGESEDENENNSNEAKKNGKNGDDEEKEEKRQKVAASPESSTDWSSQPRYGFPCKLEPPFAVREEARSRTLLIQHSNQQERDWRNGLRGLTLLAMADAQTCATLRALTRKQGCPAHLRIVVWLTMTKIAHRLDEYPSGYCAQLTRMMQAETAAGRGGSIPDSIAHSIEQDLHRTFPAHPYFRLGDGTDKMRQIMHCIWRRDPISAYCQSFNYFCATFLLVYGGDIEASFWSMLLVIETLLPGDYYNQQLTGVKIDQLVLEELVRQFLPKVANHFDALAAGSGASTAGGGGHTSSGAADMIGLLVPVWQMSLFSSALPFESALAVLDFVLSGDTREHTPAFLIVSVALLKIHQDALLVTRDTSDAAMLLNTLTDATFDWPRLLRVANELAAPGQITSELVASLRRKYRTITQQEEVAKAQRQRQTAAGSKNGGGGTNALDEKIFLKKTSRHADDDDRNQSMFILPAEPTQDVEIEMAAVPIGEGSPAAAKSAAPASPIRRGPSVAAAQAVANTVPQG